MNDSKQQRFARAVRAEHNRALAVLKAKVDILKKRPPVGLITDIRALEGKDGRASAHRARGSGAICLLPLCRNFL